MELYIKEIMQEKGITPKYISKHTDWQLPSVYGMLKSKNFTVDTLETLAGVLGCEVIDFFPHSEGHQLWIDKKNIPDTIPTKTESIEPEADWIEVSCPYDHKLFVVDAKKARHLNVVEK